MTEPKTCSTCHWWYQYPEDRGNKWGNCVWHTGVKNAPVQQMGFKGVLQTRRDFYCIKHEGDRKA